MEVCLGADSGNRKFLFSSMVFWQNTADEDGTSIRKTGGGMKLTVISDIHGALEKLVAATPLLSDSDITVISGDITRHGDLDELRYVITALKEVTRQLFAIPGNMDGKSSVRVLSALDVNLHGVGVELGHVRFIGAGGATATPFGTPFEVPESDIVKQLSRLHRPEFPGRLVVLCHNPPYGTVVDRIFLGRHVGGKGIREWVEQVQPALFLSGHIHEAAGVDKIGETVLLNPGPFRRGGIGIVTIPETGDVTAMVVNV